MGKASYCLSTNGGPKSASRNLVDRRLAAVGLYSLVPQVRVRSWTLTWAKEDPRWVKNQRTLASLACESYPRIALGYFRFLALAILRDTLRHPLYE